MTHTPWGRLNPLRVPSSSVRAQHVGAAGATYTIPTGSTTDTVNYTFVSNATITTTATKQIILVHGYMTVKHTVANAEVDIAARIYNDDIGTATVTTDQARFIVLPAVGQYHLCTFNFSFDLNYLTNTLGKAAGPGKHLLEIMVGPDTAGTMSWGESHSGDSFTYVVIGLA